MGFLNLSEFGANTRFVPERVKCAVCQSISPLLPLVLCYATAFYGTRHFTHAGWGRKENKARARAHSGDCQVSDLGLIDLRCMTLLGRIRGPIGQIVLRVPVLYVTRLT